MMQLDNNHQEDGFWTGEQVDAETGELINVGVAVPARSSLSQMPSVDQSEAIAQAHVTRLSWQKKEGVWETEDGDTFDLLQGQLWGSALIYSCWTDVIGSPSCMGYGSHCPDHPETSTHGIRVVLDTDDGLVYFDAFGPILFPSICAHIKKSLANDRKLSYKGSKIRNTRHGVFHTPKMVKE